MGCKKRRIYYGFGDFETSFEKENIDLLLANNEKITYSDFEDLECNVYLAGWTSGFNFDECKINYEYAKSKQPFLDFIENHLVSEKHIKDEKKLYFYFHNLNYDFEFMKFQLLNNFTDHSTISVIGEEGNIYQYKLIDENTENEFILLDSQNIMRMPLSAFPEVDGIKKRSDLLKQDMSIMRSLDHVATSDEIEYLWYDVMTLASGVINLLFDEWFMTTSSKAIKFFNKTVKKLKLYKYFPLTKEGYITPSDLKRLNFYNHHSLVDTEISHFDNLKNFESYYKGGFTFVNPLYQEKLLEDIKVIDVNSLYPWAMNNCKVPYIANVYSMIKKKKLKFKKGSPLKFNNSNHVYRMISDFEDIGVQILNKEYFLCFNIKMEIELKDGFAFSPYSNGFTDRVLEVDEYTSPKTRGIKRGTVIFKGSEYDLELIKKLYNISNLELVEYYIFDILKDGDLINFRSIIDDLVEQKNVYAQDKVKYAREYAMVKLILNSLTGKFGEKVREKNTRVDNGEFVEVDSDVINSRALPLIISLISRARLRMVIDILKVKDHFVYMDTDSLHLINISEDEINHLFYLHPTELGAYDLEKTYTKAIYMKPKTYVGLLDNVLKFTVAGCKPRKKLYNKYLYNMESFLDNDKVIGVKIQKVPGKNGVHLIETDFVFKGDDGIANDKFLGANGYGIDRKFLDYLDSRFVKPNLDTSFNEDQLINPKVVTSKEVIVGAYSDSIIQEERV